MRAAAETPAAFLFGAASQRRISQATILNGTAAGFRQPLVLLKRPLRAVCSRRRLARRLTR
jgi:hypothetical protein